MAHLTQLAHLSQNLHCGKESCGAALGHVEAGPPGPQRHYGSPRPFARHRGLRGPQSARTSPQDGPTMERIAHKHLRSHTLPDLIHDCVPMCDAGPAGPAHPETHRLARPHTPRATFPRRGAPERERTQVRGLAQFSLRRVPQELVGSRLLHSGCSGLLQGASTHTNGGLH